MIFHPFHLVTFRPWPLYGRFRVFSLVLGIVKWFNFFYLDLILTGLICLTICIVQWWRDVTREATYLGDHTKSVVRGIKLGIVLFIISEVCFFFSFFWAFFHRRLCPISQIGEIWPSKGITTFNPFQIPLLNSAILLSSGASVTWTHFSILVKDIINSKIRLLWTIFLGLGFTRLQLVEYLEAPFSISDSIYGTVFFVATGFHGLHVIIWLKC